MNTDAESSFHASDLFLRDVYYEVPDDQLARFRALTPYQRLRWLDEAVRFSLLARQALAGSSKPAGCDG